MTADTGVYFEGGQDFDPTHVRRAAIESIGGNEVDMSKEEIGQAMFDFYKERATKVGGKIDFYYQDGFAVLFPN